MKFLGYFGFTGAIKSYIQPSFRQIGLQSIDAWIAQSVEQRIENPRVAGSIPAPGTISFISRLCSGQSLVAPAIPSPLRWGGELSPERRLALGACDEIWFGLISPIKRTMLPLKLPPSLRSLSNLGESGQ